MINNPNALGAACGYAPNAVSLNGRTCDLGLPNFISDYVLPTAITENTKPSMLRVYPNPGNGNFVIDISSFKSSSARLSISNLLGEVIKEINLKEEKTEINIEQPDGIYFLTISTGEVIYTTKVILKQ